MCVLVGLLARVERGLGWALRLAPLLLTLVSVLSGLVAPSLAKRSCSAVFGCPLRHVQALRVTFRRGAV